MLIAICDESPLVCLRDMSYRDKHDSGLHNCIISSYYIQAVRTESRYQCQFGSNSLLFHRLKLSSSTREWTNRLVHLKINKATIKNSSNVVLAVSVRLSLIFCTQRRNLDLVCSFNKCVFKSRLQLCRDPHSHILSGRCLLPLVITMTSSYASITTTYLQHEAITKVHFLRGPSRLKRTKSCLCLDGLQCNHEDAPNSIVPQLQEMRQSQTGPKRTHNYGELGYCYWTL